MNDKKIKVAILTISDRSSQGTAIDLSGPAVERNVRGLGWDVAERAVVPDEGIEIKKILLTWVDKKKISLILTTGGTGIGSRDNTPEATAPLLEKTLPGLSDQIRREGLRYNFNTLLSRGLAGIRGTSLIINLPGNPDGAVQSLQAVAAVIPHALAMMDDEQHQHENLVQR